MTTEVRVARDAAGEPNGELQELPAIALARDGFTVHPDLDALRGGRVTQDVFHAPLRANVQLYGINALRDRRQGYDDAQFCVVLLDLLAEQFVETALARRNLRLAQRHAVGGRAELQELVVVQVKTVLDRPAQLDPVARRRRRREHENLLEVTHFVEFDRLRRGPRRQKAKGRSRHGRRLSEQVRHHRDSLATQAR